MPVSRFSETFAALRARGDKALVAFVTAGDPLPHHTANVVCALADAGADIIEIGVPFSDPLADGPTIQAASFRALQAGMTPPKVLDVVREIRARNTHTPLVLMGAYNPVMQYGVEAFARDAAEAGADGTILTDLTPEAAHEWKRYAGDAGLATIFLLAPTSTPSRMAVVGRMATGFIYTMARSGVTGARADVPEELLGLIERVRSFGGDTPICVGFGVSTPEQVREICRYADGAVVGSVLVDLLHRERDNPELLSLAADFVRALKEGTKGIPT
ncbi:MAG: tryptophan synthase subunit alpha [Armatimonadetes bacterium]|nr:tryptophan synthase subunit alpha [Armatimonadota bacterium]